MGVDLDTYPARIGCLGRTTLRELVAVSQADATARLLFKGCPRSKIVVVFFCLAQLLVCCGHIETNPGPDKIDMILSAVKEAALSRDAFQKEVNTKMRDISAGNIDIKKPLSKVQEGLLALSKCGDTITTVGGSVDEIKTDILALTRWHDSQAGLLDVVDEMNNRMRRKNQIFQALPEEEKENPVTSEWKIPKFCKGHLALEGTDIERSHRVGAQKEGYDRSLIVKFLNYKTKCEVLGNAFKIKELKTLKIWIEEDFSPRIQFVRNQLRDFAREHRQPNDKMKISFDKLLLRNRRYHYD
ncbi:hypothetical protein HPB48_019893 [Haemaphysalis longicornis]|uniref:Uncharacterized protein n=1 Tax=Haemaphysalis longicornis TaxID=44386 RepID=A0A9J6FAH4_HAELO|nr:hypothetical protein HPB48_019893 [Haemaphysalis longicornis]